MTISLGELAIQFGCELVGDPSVEVSKASTLGGADAKSISFFSNSAYREQLRNTRAAAVILRAGDAASCPVSALVDPNPYLLYARIASLLHPAPAFQPGIHPGAVVASTSRVSVTAQIAAAVVIGNNCEIGDAAIIGPGCIVGDDCVIGAGSRLVARVTLVQNVNIGARCVIHPGAVIGCDGFGNAMSQDGWVKVPQLGGVVIGDDVEIGANTTVDRGAIEDTVIGNGVRIDNLVQIAHNVRIGEHTAMAAMSGISGSTVIGKRCLFGGQSGTVGHLTICDDVIITGRAMITKDISKPGSYAGSFPAEESSTWKRRVARIRRLDSMAERLSAIEKRVDKQ
ncbi:MAG: UDP-3-O-(3-hydroxymyristoyl)glucosamine N-acyltransferase [Gammaproteobacteria bacterium]|nr:UDP-3-O-(3-hydroxymyristoyl)glucosamine N-acyltransferase [Gammaproteobacteria bacterium]MDH4313564.1 UDP-3-O-(3-hydroxymyristoyl)glucosamine N-acyltransferase [Gammaproteobacteria bacterium]MDH5212633.1 UDP-3-O-(3-hydroxymyristoyl)glucosamine N-acyltransferase [Gammaproteobacteria bacterium]MDH5501188.1 UDP-3-O-(3-hydroxymyristoyl)glucosamine N-acyltransferase [Gammaproteobacteria bacterium]